ncbi:peptidylprolyl isomerase [Oceanospirillaceae bacterium]|nr:peptidylprolyl isomerase [Oceanospirillaceae bacterium]MDB9753644.1 peptidylprolyl isomerase [Oceanospirillaceae bacterium]MDC1341066.1 peptidylprolyl isomerase [Oceanospirillaceae bacterium]MDC1509946.1 peptidylprolyl isomerase [Oceanospirillaceae bacterium]
MTQSINTSSHVKLNFALHHASGQTIDSTFDKGAVQLIIGDGNLLEGFESCLIGLVAGDHQTFMVPPQEAFGQHNPANLQTIKRHQFGPDMVLEQGLVVSFSDAANTELPGVVKTIDGDNVVVDFNHPLAGVELKFEVEILEVS